MRVLRAIAALLALGLAAPAMAQQFLTGDEIRQAFDGNTVSGRFVVGNRFSEYHATDGRALGNGGWGENTDACWTVRNDNVCYYYGPLRGRITHCYTVQAVGRLYVLRHLTDPQLTGAVTIEPGNPRNLGDHGKPWICDGLISRAPGQGAPMSRRLAAAQ
ncbi:hypothetical protein DWF00_05985 [Bosea caraganae]|uniref:DUF995 domain-containing protein n=1 Tax=Bosea caraganae TaxID=2763117 RepID=A0A370L3E9_9HYPH|nr:hypothetical protein [Bosea caraganae]RDJ22913.1 hypothetical protein DWE98_17230 [Bosea caraganae]RDJ28693.1 hypothetical protein DWF00_05985 [Bosea caraganae]